MDRFVVAVALLGVVAVASMATAAFPVDGEYAASFASWMVQYGKTYGSIGETAHRYTVFADNMAKIERHNSLNKSWTMGMNEYGDLTWDEFKARFLRANKPMKSNRRVVIEEEYNHYHHHQIPTSIDWVEKKKVNPIQNQGACGSCWAFSAVASIESALAIKTGKLHKFAEQELVDCSDSYGNGGCEGGFVDQAFKFVEDEGLCLEKSYKYQAIDGTCQRCKSAANINSYVDVTRNSPKALQKAVAKQPVSIAIEADSDSFQFYFGGVFDDESCGDELDHAVVVVGYGKDKKSHKNFWKIRNSWGKSWGEKGYIRFLRTKDGGPDGDGMCGMLSAPSYPVA